MMRFFIFAVGMAASVQLNPVTRVVQLMEGLVKKCKADGEAEQELYDKFKCWCKKARTSGLSDFRNLLRAQSVRVFEVWNTSSHVSIAYVDMDDPV